MKITDTNAPRPISNSSLRRKSSAGAANFLDFLSAADDAASVGDAAPVEATTAPYFDAMLSLQEMPEEDIRRRKVMQRGQNALDQLDQLRHALLMGRVPAHVLRNLTNFTTDQRIAAADPRLREVMDEIELRAAVELAKLEMAQDAQK